MVEVFERTVTWDGGDRWSVAIGFPLTGRYFGSCRAACQDALQQGLDSGADVITVTIERP